jgi:hypothetical protein
MRELEPDCRKPVVDEGGLAEEREALPRASSGDFLHIDEGH